MVAGGVEAILKRAGSEAGLGHCPEIDPVSALQSMTASPTVRADEFHAVAGQVFDARHDGFLWAALFPHSFQVRLLFSRIHGVQKLVQQETHPKVCFPAPHRPLISWNPRLRYDPHTILALRRIISGRAI